MARRMALPVSGQEHDYSPACDLEPRCTLVKETPDPMRLYLAGPMRGYDLLNFPAFDSASAWLREDGYKVWSPAEGDREIGSDEHATPDQIDDAFMAAAVRRDLEAILKVDAIALLPGWEDSAGSTFELDVTSRLGLPAFELKGERTPDGWHWLELCRLGGMPMPEAEDSELGRLLAEEQQIADRIMSQRPTAGQVVASLLASSGEVRITSPTGGEKGEKLARFDLIPPDVLWELAEHYGYGAQKYPNDPETGEANWQKGYAWHLCVAALLRHLMAWLNGEDDDPELGDNHLIAVAWHAFALRWFQLHGRGVDDVRRKGMGDSERWASGVGGPLPTIGDVA